MTRITERIFVRLTTKHYCFSKKLANICVCLLVSCGQTSASKDDNQPPETDAPRHLHSSSASKNSYEFNLPYLLNRNIKQITQELGRAKEEDTNNLTDNELERRYSRAGYTAVITYDKKSGKVESILLTSAKKQIVPVSLLLSAGNLRSNNKDYSVDTLADTKGNFVSVVITNSQ